MLEKSFGLFFYLKQTKTQKCDERYVYLRITVDGKIAHISTKRLWQLSKWSVKEIADVCGIWMVV